jgi:hypothetical protein
MHTKKVLIHLAAWLVWYSLNSIAFLYIKVPLWPVLYNYVSLMIVFYCCYFIGLSYWNRPRLTDALMLNRWQRVRFFVWRWQIPALFAVAWAYIGVSWLADNYFVQTGILKNPIQSKFLWYADSRFTREAFYILAGLSLASVTTIIRRKNDIIRAEKALNIITMQENAMMKNTYYKKIRDLRHTVKNALEEQDMQ